ncbi:MAG: NADH-quinone oxidoreductase subunit J [Caldilineaceae bacterium]|nr:NADH-quinone oxidoreductase subunit J [Caldilineaceae bacterium]
MTLPLIFFLLVGAVCLAAAVGVVLSRQPVHSALFLLANFATLAVLYVMLEAQFLAAAQVIVYAGGIVILILFVIMLIGGDTNDFSASQRTWSRYAGILLGVIMLGSLGYAVLLRIQPVSPEAVMAVEGGAPPVIGLTLFTQYILPFELVAILLLVALLGALVLGRQPEEEAAPRVREGDTLPNPVPPSHRQPTQHDRPVEPAREKELQSP